MNYKIKVTAENREAIKDIAERNKMNSENFIFRENKTYYIKNGIFPKLLLSEDFLNWEELTFEQFKAMFDKQETDLDKWLMETKAKNLSLDELWNEIAGSSAKIGRQLKGETLSDKALILYSQWNEPKPHGFCEEKNSKCTDNYCDDNGCVARKRILTEPKEEWHPKRGDRVLVWDNIESSAEEKIFLVEIKGCKLPIRVVAPSEETKFLQGQVFSSSGYKHMKPLPPTKSEKTFKDKVIEVLEAEIKEGAYRLNDLLDKIKELN